MTAIVAYAVYVALVTVLWRRAGVDYPHLADSRETTVAGIVRPIGIGAVFLLVVTTLLGWWGPVLVDSPTADAPWWVWVAPSLMAVGAVAGIATLDWMSAEARHTLGVIALGCLFVGVAEEVLTRGLILVGAREAGWSEVAAAALATVLFGLLHVLNGWFGLSWRSTAAQVGLSSVAGLVFYLTRSATGTLVVPILLHALWDLGTLGGVKHGRGARYLQPIAGMLAYVAALVCAGILLLG